VDSPIRCLIVEAGGARFAVPLEQVLRVISAQELHPVPGAAPRLLGLTRFGGEPLAVIDFGLLVDSRPTGGNGREVVVVSGGEGPMVGLAVDEALQVVEFEPDERDVRGADHEGAIRLIDPASLLDHSTEVNGETPTAKI
jgi:chemotaxis signal transduction protein